MSCDEPQLLLAVLKPVEKVFNRIESSSQSNGSQSSALSVAESELKSLEDIDFSGWSDDEELKSEALGRSSSSSMTSSSTPPKKRIKLTHGQMGPVADSPRKINRSELAIDRSYSYVVVRIDGKVEGAVTFQIKSVRNGELATLRLKDFWAHSQVLRIGWKINLVDTEMDENQVFTIDKTGGFIVVEPDRLLTVTSIVNQLWCPRKAVLAEKFHYPVDNEDILRGIIAHDLISQAMLGNVKRGQKLNEIVDKILAKPAIIQKAYGLRFDGSQLASLARDLVPYVVRFMASHFKTQKANKEHDLSILAVRDIEDNYWNPAFGLKGKLDATIRVRTKNGKMMTVPLEFKTGNPELQGVRRVRLEHTAQVDLYTLLLRPRYGYVDRGVLYYIREQFWNEENVKGVELQQLIKMRNDLAIGINTQNGVFTDLPRPDVGDYDRTCLRCEYKTVCSLLAQGRGTEECQMTNTERCLQTSIFNYSEAETDFFKNWFTVITTEIEAGEKSNNVAALWTVPPREREKKGKCLGDLELITASQMQSEHPIGNPCHLATFMRVGASGLLKDSEIRESDFVILSTLDELCICYCTVYNIDFNANTITVSMEVKLNERSSQFGTVFTIDKMPFKSPLAIQYSYLSALMAETSKSKRLRRYIIDKKRSHLREAEIADTLKPTFEKCNESQRSALRKSLKTDAFLFVVGMPGTGKTHTISCLLELLVLLGKNVLVVAYTGTAVDNILLKYKKVSNDFIRLGDSSKLRYPELKEHYTSEIVGSASGVDDFREKINSVPVVATTMLSLKHEVFRVRYFDYVIIDEASQALPTAAFGALLLGERYILFGDPKQLPPVLQTKVTTTLGLQNNLFDMLAKDEFTHELTTQYRMNVPIMTLANKLVYDNKMKCGTKDVAKSRLKMDSSVALNYLKTLPSNGMRSWMCYVASFRTERSVMFLDTCKVKALDTFGVDKTYRNEIEAKIVIACTQTFLECGVAVEELGIISPYRGQVELIRTKCKQLGGKYANVEVNTVDQYQGREKTVILCSFTRNCPSGSTNEGPERKTCILDDLRRLNVAITRAKQKLIMVGSKEFLSKIEVFKNLFTHLTENQGIQLRDGDLEGL